MKLSMGDMRGKHEGKPALLLGLGPSLNPHIPKLQEYRDNGIVLFSCNQWHRIFTHPVPDYWLLCNTKLTVEKYSSYMNQFNSTVIYADTVDLTPRDVVDTRLTCDYLPYDQHHMGGQKCPQVTCCLNLPQGRKSIQEELMELSGHPVPFPAVGTVALQMLAFAIVAKCNPIYFVGIDIDYRLGYALGKIPKQPASIFDRDREGIVKSFGVLKEIADKMGITVINVSDTPTFSVFDKGKIE